jgi:hypothetical protein
MLDVSKNQHRWKRSLDDKNRRLLEEAADTLAWAWKTDMKDPKSHPMNTELALSGIRKQIKDRQLPSRNANPAMVFELPAPPPPPKCFSELVNEGTIRAVYENQNAGSYKDALKRAAKEDDATFRKILNAIGQAYHIDRAGPEVAPKPRNHFLHRNLLELAALVGLDDLNHQGVVEFLDDLCPCAIRHQTDAIRKLRQRLAAKSSSKS